MTQGLNQIGNKLNDGLGNRCSNRETRPRMRDFPPYYPLRDKWTTIPYSFTDNSGMTLSGEMSDTVVVILLPRAFEAPGSAPGGNQLEPITRFLLTNYPQHNFIKGHMWNQEVGGEGKTNNLVPLTSRANSAHKNNAESPLKEALRSFESYYENNSRISKVYGFQYRVEIQEPTQDKGLWRGVSQGIVPNAIYVKASPIEIGFDNLGRFRYEYNISIIEVVPTANNVRRKIEALNNGIWIDQEGQVTPA